MIASAFLRSYMPKGNLPAYQEHVGPTRAFIRGDEHFLWREPVVDDAFEVIWGDETYVCPRHSRLRMLEGVLAFNNAFPGAGLIPEPQVINASAQLEELRSQASSMRSYILTSPWHVPIRWFAAFLHEERELYQRDGAMSVRYRTSFSAAQERVERAVQIVEGAGFDPSVVGQVQALASWLDGFSPDGMVELDYAAVGELFSEADLVLDESAADTAASLLALEQGNFDEAGAFYGNVVRRWGRLQSLAFAN
ncbi:MAG: hypothetical protein QNL12_13670 [Acidimicrobiia bacterium]|nr:hypothetical protein [Acidimicrobiia bacterium]MDX2468361.1 hypothetical protein [Acidimicrobiia bacterium]